jgi:hypothetical protein
MKYQNNCRDRTKIPICISWRKVEILDFAEAEDKISLQKKSCVGSAKAVFGIKSRSIKSALIPC